MYGIVRTVTFGFVVRYWTLREHWIQKNSHKCFSFSCPNLDFKSGCKYVGSRPSDISFVFPREGSKL